MLGTMKEPQWLRRARQAIESGAASRVEMARIAEQVGVHPVHLSRTFHRVYGMPATRYLRMRRLARAARALAGEATISAIAVEAGFTDHAHFSRVFRRAYRMTPSDYRAMIRETGASAGAAEKRSPRLALAPRT